MEHIHADAVVIGAGPAGCAAALGLVGSGAKVVLCERGLAPSFKPGEIMEPSVREPLSELGILAGFERLGFPPLAGNISIWDDETVAERSGTLSADGGGILIERPAFETWLLEEAQKAGVVVLRGGSVADAEEARGSWTVVWKSGVQPTQLTAPFLIEACGRAAGIANQGARQQHDRLVAFLTYGSTAAGPQDQSLLIEAAEEGWWYAAALPKSRAVVAYLTDADLLPRAAAARTEFINLQLGRSKLVRFRAEAFIHKDDLRGFPASSGIREALCGHSWVAVGDAAATYDPLAGFGVAVALAKGAAAARLIASSSDLALAAATYADAERTTFAEYLDERRRTYARAARTRVTSFWSRRLR